MTKIYLQEYANEKCKNWSPEWKAEIFKLIDFVDLQQGWDSYNAPPIKPSIVQFALDFILYEIPRHYQPPQIVPRNNTGLQFEWHVNEMDLEVYFSPLDPQAISLQPDDGAQKLPYPIPATIKFYAVTEPELVQAESVESVNDALEYIRGVGGQKPYRVDTNAGWVKGQIYFGYSHLVWRYILWYAGRSHMGDANPFVYEVD